MIDAFVEKATLMVLCDRIEWNCATDPWTRYGRDRPSTLTDYMAQAVARVQKELDEYPMDTHAVEFLCNWTKEAYMAWFEKRQHAPPNLLGVAIPQETYDHYVFVLTAESALQAFLPIDSMKTESVNVFMDMAYTLLKEYVQSKLPSPPVAGRREP
jgi:hypothetical protein